MTVTRKSCPLLTIQHILAWADAHHQRTGKWPNSRSGPVEDAPGEKWNYIQSALAHGQRGLPGGSSLAQLLGLERGVRNIQALPPLTIRQILAWADAHHEKTGRWPNRSSGPVDGAPGETWSAITAALHQCHRGLPRRSSLAKLLAKRRGVQVALTVQQVLAWADAHHKRSGKWPTTMSGTVVGATGETWRAIDRALRRGSRGLSGGSSLPALLTQHRGYRRKLPRRIPQL